jgi:hypothetical protein
MAAPITHVILAEKMFPKYFSHLNRKKFFVGTCFPDIRYLGVIDREKTHFLHPKLNHIQKENSFMAGVMFHSLVDEARNYFIRNYPKLQQLLKIVLKLTASKPNQSNFEIAVVNSCSKLLEDERHYDKSNNWQTYIIFLNDVLPEEVSFDIPQKTIKKWHLLLSKYFSQKPNDWTRKRFFLAENFSRDEVERRNTIIKKIKSIKIVNQLIEDFYNNFEEITNSVYLV